MQILRRIAALALALLVVAAPAPATWSLVVVNTRTHEVCVAGATCLELTNLKSLIAVVRVEKGGAVAQAAGDVFVQNRPILRRGLRLGTPPWKILGELDATDNQHQSRQYGIVDLRNPALTFTGSAVNPGKFGVTGQDGELRYAIQGNLLTGEVVVLAAELAFLTAEGDLTQRVMAAMEAARGLGGDGRCSCGNSPMSCGAPPPDFTSSALSSFLVLARPGDTDSSFAGGDYYLDIKGNSEPESILDAVQELQLAYDAWRAGMAGVPDQVRSQIHVATPALTADGESYTEVVVSLADVDGARAVVDGLRLDVTPTGGVAAACRVGTVEDRRDGTYAFKVVAGRLPGDAAWEVRVRGGERDVLLHPGLFIKVVSAVLPDVGR